MSCSISDMYVYLHRPKSVMECDVNVYKATETQQSYSMSILTLSLRKCEKLCRFTCYACGIHTIRNSTAGNPLHFNLEIIAAIESSKWKTYTL